MNTYVAELEKPNSPDILVQVVSWVLGEYAALSTVEGSAAEHRRGTGLLVKERRRTAKGIR